MVTAQIILLSRWFSKKNLLKNPIKKTNTKYPVKMVESKSTCPKWHFSQVGHQAKNTIRGIFFTEILGQKIWDFL